MHIVTSSEPGNPIPRTKKIDQSPTTAHRLKIKVGAIRLSLNDRDLAAQAVAQALQIAQRTGYALHLPRATELTGR